MKIYLSLRIYEDGTNAVAFHNKEDAFQYAVDALFDETVEAEMEGWGFPDDEMWFDSWDDEDDSFYDEDDSFYIVERLIENEQKIKDEWLSELKNGQCIDDGISEFLRYEVVELEVQ